MEMREVETQSGLHIIDPKAKDKDILAQSVKLSNVQFAIILVMQRVAEIYIKKRLGIFDIWVY